MPNAIVDESLYAQLRELVADRARPAAERLRAAIEAIHHARPRHSWTGIYFLKGATLELGPFVGPPTEHTRIAVGQGLCGQAIAQHTDLDVGDVSQAEGYLACSIGVRSEAIVLIHHRGEVIGQIDVDSHAAGQFGEEAMASLRKMAEILAPLAAEARA